MKCSSRKQESNMICKNCGKELNFAADVLKQFTNCPFCGAVLPQENKDECLPLLNECPNPIDEENAEEQDLDVDTDGKKPHFGKILRQIVNEYDGLEIFSEENISRLRKAISHIEPIKNQYYLQILIKRRVPQRLYACVNLPQDEKVKALKTCKKELLGNHFSEEYCYDVLSILSLLMFKVKLTDLDKEFAQCKKDDVRRNMPDAKAFIARIDGFEQIHGAAYLEIAKISGVNVVVKKGEYSVGERVVYIRPNTRVDSDLACFDYLKDSDYYVKKRKFRGSWSEGIIAKTSDLGITDVTLNKDVSDIVQGRDDSEDEEQDGPIDDQDIRHWKEEKFFKNVYSSKQFREADLESKMEMRRAAKQEAKMIKGLRKDAGLDSGCYITTAICEASGKADNCYELTVLRKFRDEWLAKQPDGMYLINDYYETAPKIVSAINLRDDRNSVYSFLESNFLKKCLSFIKKSQMMDCKKCYIDMVQYCYRFLANKVSK